MIIAAALCPAPPLLARELTGADPVVADLRQACRDAVAALVQAGPEVIVVAGTAPATRTRDAGDGLELARYAPALALPGPADRAGLPGGVTADEATAAGAIADGNAARRGAESDDGAVLPPSLGLGARLLGEAGYAGPRVLQGVSEDEPPDACAALGAALAGTAGRVALLAMADGSARRTLKAPGYLDDRAVPFDAGVEAAVRDGDWDALLAVDAQLARDLMATGRPGWQVLAGALRGTACTTAIRYSADPFGVAYLVASLTAGPPGG